MSGPPSPTLYLRSWSVFIFELHVSDEYTPGELNREVYSVLSSVRKSLFSPSEHFCTTECKELRNKSLSFRGSLPIRSPFSTEKPPRGRVLVSSGPYFFLCLPMRKRNQGCDAYPRQTARQPASVGWDHTEPQPLQEPRTSRRPFCLEMR